MIILLSPYHEDELGTPYSFERHDLITGHMMVGVSRIQTSNFWHIHFAHPSLIKDPLATPTCSSSEDIKRLADNLCGRSGAILFNSKQTN